MVTIDNAGESYRMNEWEDYRSDTGWDLNSPDPSDPLFRDVSGNLQLNRTSPAVDAGVYYPEISTDIDRNTRDIEFPDIGAFEYQISDDIPLSSDIKDTIFYTGNSGCFDATQSVIVAGDGNAVFFQSGSSIDLISGNSISFLPGTTIQEGANIVAYITSDNSYCFNVTEMPYAVAQGANNNQTIWRGLVFDCYEYKPEMIAYPTINNGIFTLEFKNFDKEQEVLIYNSVGKCVKIIEINYNKTTVDISSFSNGMFILKSINKKEIKTARVLKN